MRGGDEHRGPVAGGPFPVDEPQTYPVVPRTTGHRSGVTLPLCHHSEEAKVLAWDHPVGTAGVCPGMDVEPLQVMGTQRYLVNTQ